MSWIFATSGSDKAKTKPLSRQEKKKCHSLLKQCEMFHKVPDSLLQEITKKMRVKTLEQNDILIKQGQPTNAFYLIQHGTIQRKHINPNDGKVHNVEFAIKAKSIDSMRVISGEPSFSTVKCTSPGSCVLYEMQRERFLQLLHDQPELSKFMLEGLCEQLRVGSKKYATPLLEQRGSTDTINVPAVSIAAGIESYYRSALNAMLNARLTGVKADYFPNMHIQVPTRIAYITGFKGLRATLDTYIDNPEQYSFPTLVNLAKAITPGIFMTPISSVLEASNAGHMNPEPMATRWMRGALPRGGREIIFGIGLNQMSDYFEERVLGMYLASNVGPDSKKSSSNTSNNDDDDDDTTDIPVSKLDDDNTSDNTNHPMLANAIGSLMAGVVSGYFSHVPHNLSTLKLLEPSKSYRELYSTFVNKSVPPVFQNYVSTLQISANSKSILRTIFATLFPRGLIVRTTQIVGSFIILNGTINYLHLREHYKIERAVAGGEEPPAVAPETTSPSTTLLPSPPPSESESTSTSSSSTSMQAS